MTAWIVVTVVSKSATSWEIATFITAWSSTIRNCAAPRTAKTPHLAMSHPRREYRLEVGFVLVRVGLGVVADRLVEALALTEVGGDRGRVSGAGMGAGEGRSAEAGIDRHPLRAHRLDLGAPLAVPELADVEVAAPTVEAVHGHPAEEHVAARLHQALADDDTTTMVVERAGTRKRLEDRGARL